MEKSYKNFRTGDTITVKEPVKCYYYNYPTGKNLIEFLPGEKAVIIGFPPKVRRSNGSLFFAMFDAKGERFGCDVSNLIKVKTN